VASRPKRLQRRNSLRRTPAQPLDARGARVAALDMLARRDYSSTELARKLGDLGLDAALLAELLERLVAEKLLDDDRYTADFIRARAARGQGPLRIRAELRQRGLAGPPVEEAIAAFPDWPGVARTARLKKFRSKAPASAAERARQVRFLSYRGFTSAQVRAALGWDIDLGADDDGL
jgi:regulatory protein